MRIHLASLFIVGAFVIGCHRHTQPLPPQNLLGVKVSFYDHQMAAQGFVETHPARVKFDITRLLGSVSDGCFWVRPDIEREVNIPDILDGKRNTSWVRVSNVQVEGRNLGTRLWELRFEEKECLVTLGLDVLSAYAFDIRPELHAVTLLEAKAKEAYGEARPGVGVQLTPSPKTDWPLLALQLWTEEATLGANFVLSTFHSTSYVNAKLLRGQTVKAVEIAPRVFAQQETWQWKDFPSTEGVDGILGADVWSAWDGVLDLRRGEYRIRTFPALKAPMLKNSKEVPKMPEEPKDP